MAVRGKKVDIDIAELEKLCVMQAADQEIADFYGISTRTLERRRQDPAVAEAMQRGRAKGKLTVRRHQFRILEEGNATMGIWLGKQYLGQAEQPATIDLTGQSIVVFARANQIAPAPGEEDQPVLEMECEDT